MKFTEDKLEKVFIELQAKEKQKLYEPRIIYNIQNFALEN
jgi:hypothetical protein